jgi:hypothetical protein|tara:strand:+ start:302 stop:667 length:366 start_codon:yes stop_codon:yes gene_type:complete
MMGKIDVAWKIFGIYLLILVLVCLCGKASGQISVSQFNAKWNETNEVSWVFDLKDCTTIAYVDIAANPKMQAKHKIAAIPTIIVFKDDIEVARFQADLSFKMMATRKEVQEEIDNILMSDF